MAILFVGRASGSTLIEPTSTRQAPFCSTGSSGECHSCRNNFRNSQLQKQGRRQGCAGYKKRPVTPLIVGHAGAGLARVSAAVSGEAKPNQLKLLDCVAASPAGNTRGGR
jgi:hypothetical protein